MKLLAVEGETKVERASLQINAYDVDMVAKLARPNTASGAGGVETFRNACYLVNKETRNINQRCLCSYRATKQTMPLVSVNYIALASTPFVQGIVGGLMPVVAMLNQTPKDQTVSQSMV